MQAVDAVVAHLREQMSKVIVGQSEMVDQCVLALLCSGHVLVEGVPGIAKTLTVKALAGILQLQFQRVQATSDLMPADILGTNVLNMATSTFGFHAGPVFTDLLLVDEVNRMPPRTQAALLECMEERQVTVDGTRHPLSPFFTVFATQNPIEFEGTYPLPEAQLDRFLMKINVDYPSAEDETRLLGRFQQGFDSRDLAPLGLQALDPNLLTGAREEVRNGVRVEEGLFNYIVRVARATRESPALSLGTSPRAAVNLMQAAKATAAMDQRDYVIPDDVKAAALPILRHRVLLKPEAELEGLTADQILRDLVRTIEVPQ
ncbi:MAG TPA: MoxR family ATPase [Candidatus Binatia bacterium]|nr:MoxR family ATPase [Candidatus Binatia bacterium]